MIPAGDGRCWRHIIHTPPPRPGGQKLEARVGEGKRSLRHDNIGRHASWQPAVVHLFYEVDGMLG